VRYNNSGAKICMYNCLFYFVKLDLKMIAYIKADPGQGGVKNAALRPIMPLFLTNTN
jgi:hypothetical protein